MGYSNQICSICLENFEKKQKIYQIKSCSHIYHASCIEVWLQEKLKCPLCKTKLK